MKNHQRLILIVIIVACVGGLIAYSKIFHPKSNDPKQYKPYNFTDKDHAELTITTFIRAIENADLKYASILLENNSKYNETYMTLTSFCTMRQSMMDKKDLIIQPKEFVYNDSGFGSMICNIKKINKSYETIITTIDAIKKEGTWRIACSSEFFAVLNNNYKKKSEPTQEVSK